MRTHPLLVLLTWLGALLLTSLSLPALGQVPPVAHAARSSPTALFLGLDTSGSMMRGGRYETATRAASTTVERLPLDENLRVVLVAASDSVSVVGTFVLTSEADRSALLRALHGMQPLRATHTSFSRIDEGLAETIRERLQPDEQPAVVLFTDGQSDDPAHDLAATNLGRHAREVGRGVIAVWSGAVPVEPTMAANALARRTRPLPPTRSDVGRAQLLELVEATPARWSAAAQHLTAAETFLAGLRGERSNAEAFATLSNPAPFARTYALEALPIDGVSISFPTTVTVPSGGSVRVPVRVAFQAPRAEAILHLVARAPGERAATPARIALTFETVPWWHRHLSHLIASTLMLLGLLVVWRARTQRSITLANAQDPSSRATIAPGDRVLLTQLASTFSPDAGALERDRWGRLFVRAGTTPLTCNGAVVSPGARAPYLLGAHLQLGSESLRVIAAPSHGLSLGSTALSGTDQVALEY